MFERVAIVNRGEPAVRFTRAAREWNRQHPDQRLRTIALHTAAERHAMFVRESDEAVEIAPRPGGHANPYLDLDVLGDALQRAGADACWVGWGFVAERPEFAELCSALGVTFIGPPPGVMRALGDKIGSKLLAEQAGVPVAAWSGGAVATAADAVAHAERIGFPLVVKATAGGGGRGIRVVLEPGELASAFESAQGEAERSFGDGTVFLEKMVSDAHHVEVQIVADGHGTVWTLGVRDCSVQRRRQKVIEESASVTLSAKAEQSLRESARQLALLAGYRNAGTVEFLYQPALDEAAFLEVNTRLQVEHPVTEETTGVDIVKLQILVASGARLEGEPPPARGHAVEARLNAEDPDRGFAPAPGRVDHLELPSGPGVRVDTGVAAGDVIPSEYDSMIAKIVATGADRAEALARLGRALEETVVIVDGGTTNKSFLLTLLEQPEVQAGSVTTGWLDAGFEGPSGGERRGAAVALIGAALEACDEEDAIEQTAFFAAAARGRPRIRPEVGYRVELRYDGQQYTLDAGRYGPGRYWVALDGERLVVQQERLRPYRSRLTVSGHPHQLVTAVQGADILVEVDGVSHRVSRDEVGVVRAPAPGLVVAVPVAVDDIVEAGAPLAVLEAMKMETAITAPVGGRVREVLVTRNVQVEAGAPLVRIEPLDTAGPTAGGTRVAQPEPPGESVPSDPAEQAIRQLAVLRWALLGFDFDRVATDYVLQRYLEARRQVGDDPAVLEAELGLLALFSDLSALSRNRRADTVNPDTAHNEREYLLTYLGSLDLEREGLPSTFATKLRTALGHYGIADLEPGPALRGALFRLYLSQQRAADHAPIVRTVLDRVGEAAASPEARSDTMRAVLDRLVLATQLRFPGIGEQARTIRYRFLDMPPLEDRRLSVYARVQDAIDDLDGGAPEAVRTALMNELVTCPYPLTGLAVERSGQGRSRPDPLLEAIVRRYYVIRDLRDLEPAVIDGLQVVTAIYGPVTSPVRVVALAAPLAALGQGVTVLDRLLTDDGTETVVELYVIVDEPGDGERTVRAQVLELLESPAFEHVQRLNVALADHGGGAPEILAYRRAEAGLVKDPVGWGLHPMIAERLDAWRLDNFDVRRLPSMPEVVLLDCVAKENPSDRRLLVLAEVRDVTMVRDGAGKVVALPEFEHVLTVCVAELRNALTAEANGDRLEWNRIVLYTWPVVDAPLDELAAVVRDLAPITEGVGIEQVLIHANLLGADGTPEPVVARVSHQPAAGVQFRVTEPPSGLMLPHDTYARKVLQARRRGAVYPYELIPTLVQRPGEKAGSFTELDLDETGERLVEVDRPYGENRSGIIAGLASTPSATYPEGMTRVVLMGDPLKSLGSLAEPECRRVIGALRLATERQAPIEWFALSSGAKIAMDSGVENMDWVARALREIVEFTQRGGEINVIVSGINVGAQPYWNAEATMLMHTKGILVMTPDGAMVLTGKQALDYSGGVSAEDNFGIGGYDRIMGPNGEAQYWAADLTGAVGILFDHYDHAYVAPGERFPRRAATADPTDRDVSAFPHPSDVGGLATVGEIFSSATNPDRKKPFDIRTVLRAVSDQDHPLLERWPDMRDAVTGVVVDAHLGGYPVSLIGFESKPVPRFGLLNADGPDQWSAGTLFPLSSKKVARGINAASGNRPVVILANLSGFDGSPESLRRVQLEYGAEIGRAVVNFDGPIVFCLISRYHGGAFVVFSGALNDNMEVLAVEGSFASVIGGAPAAAVVFAGEVRTRTEADDRVRTVRAALDGAEGFERARLAEELADVTAAVRSEMLGTVASEFDAVHSIERARSVGAVHRIVATGSLRAELVAAVERGMGRVARDR